MNKLDDIETQVRNFRKRLPPNVVVELSHHDGYARMTLTAMLPDRTAKSVLEYSIVRRLVAGVEIIEHVPEEEWPQRVKEWMRECEGLLHHQLGIVMEANATP